MLQISGSNLIRTIQPEDQTDSMQPYAVAALVLSKLISGFQVLQAFPWKLQKPSDRNQSASGISQKSNC